MIVSQFEKTLFQKLHKFFEKEGFELLEDKKQFRQRIPSGFLNVILSVSNYDDECLVEVNFGCRHQMIEQIAQQFLNNFHDFWDDANTLVVSIGKFSDAKYFRYKVHDEEDLDEICLEIQEFFKNRGFDFMKDACSLASLDLILNHEPRKPCKYVYNQIHRCIKGLICAKLTNRDNFLDLAELYRGILVRAGCTPNELHSYERLLSYLLYHSAN